MLCVKDLTDWTSEIRCNTGKCLVLSQLWQWQYEIDLGHHKKITYQFKILFCVGCAHRHDTNDPAKISPSMIFNGRHRWMVVCAICRMCTQLAVIHFSKEKLFILWGTNSHIFYQYTIKQGNYSLRRPPKLIIPKIFTKQRWATVEKYPDTREISSWSTGTRHFLACLISKENWEETPDWGTWLGETWFVLNLWLILRDDGFVEPRE